MDNQSALQQVIGRIQTLGSMIRGLSTPKLVSPVVESPMPDVNDRRAMQSASNQRFAAPKPQADTSYVTPAWLHQQQLNALRLSGQKESDGTYSAFSQAGRDRVLTPQPPIKDPKQVAKAISPKINRGSVVSKSAIKTKIPTMTPNPSPTPIPGAGSSTMNQYTDNFIKKVIVPMAQQYDVDPGIVAGQFANEGRLGGIGASRNNFFNIGVTDAIVEAAKQSGDWSQVPGYQSPESGVERYLLFISGQGPDSMYANGVDGSASGKVGKKQFQEAWAKYRHNPPAFLRAIGPTYASTGDAYAINTMATPEYQAYTRYR